MLKIENLQVHYGGIQALRGISLEVPDGRIVTQFMSANGVFALMRAFAVSKRADLIAALSLEAFDGRIDPFMDCI